MTQTVDIPSFLSLAEKIIVVSGAGSGIGFSTARHLLDMGATVILLDKDEKKIETAVLKLKKHESRIIGIHGDVTKEDDCLRAVKSSLDSLGRIDVLVNNAGMIIRKDIVSMTVEEWNLVLDVNLKGVYLLSRCVIPHMVERGGGSIIHIASGWGLKGGPKAAAYCAAKAGVVNLTKAMAIDHGPQGIRVNCICPGDTETPLLHSEANQLGEREEHFLEKAAERPLGRVGQPDDVALAVLFFASDMSSWVTGSSLVVDGGGLA
jgi:NAD(P)-dependent dehydrogenase (short-subunit alcohol dehydrogenase family)